MEGLPLPPDYFSKTRLSERECKYYCDLAQDMVEKSIHLATRRAYQWVHVSEKKGISLFRSSVQPSDKDSPTTTSSNISQVSCRSQLTCDLSEIEQVYMAPTEQIHKRLMRRMNPKILDSVLIHTIIPRTPEAPYRSLAIRWFVIKSSAPMVSDRDYCCLEVSDRVEDASGNTTFIRVLESIDLQDCPSLLNRFGFIRGNLQTAFIYRAEFAKSRNVQAYHITRFDPCGYYPSHWIYKVLSAELYSSLFFVRETIEQKRLSVQTFIGKEQWVPDAQRPHCVICRRVFGAFRHRHHCRSCGEVICRKCSVFIKVDLPGVGRKKLRTCTSCTTGINHFASSNAASSQLSQSSIASSFLHGPNEMALLHEPCVFDLDQLRCSSSGALSPSARSTVSIGSSKSTQSSSRRTSRSKPLKPVDLSYVTEMNQYKTVADSLLLGQSRRGGKLRSLREDVVTDDENLKENLTQVDQVVQQALLKMRFIYDPKDCMMFRSELCAVLSSTYRCSIERDVKIDLDDPCFSKSLNINEVKKILKIVGFQSLDKQCFVKKQSQSRKALERASQMIEKFE